MKTSAEHIQSMLQALVFIEEHLQAEISIADIADAVHCSLYHFSRVFNRVVHHTPYDYLMRRRLSETALALVETTQPVIRIALDYGFNNPETFSRAFRKMFQMSPQQLRRRGAIDPLRLLAPLDEQQIQFRNQNICGGPEKKEWGPLFLSGIMGQLVNGGPGIRDLNHCLDKQLRGIPGDGNPAARYHFFCATGNSARDCVFYFTGVQTEAGDALPPFFVSKTIPRQQYVKFSYGGELDSYPILQDYIFKSWYPRSQLELTIPPVFVLVTSQAEDDIKEMYIPVPA